MTKFETLKLKSGKDKAVDRKHPWIFSGAFKNIPTHLDEGALVRVVDHKSGFKAMGFFGKGSIAVKILSFEEAEVEEIIPHLIKKAIEYRKRLSLLDQKDTNCCRLVFGEGDQLPGLVIDRYDQTAVVQLHHAGWTPYLKLISTTLISEVVRYVYHKPVDKIGQDEKGWLTEACDQTEVLEYGHRFKIDWEEGQKTGFFLDQRENRKKLADYAKGKSILNTFSYTGGFSIYALAAGASRVVSVDISKAAIDLAHTNAEINGYAEQHEAVVSDVLQHLKNEGADFDIIILDPPAFSKSRKTIHNAIQGYKRLNARAISNMKSGGLIFTFSCSQHMSAQLFEDTIRAAAIETGRPVRIVERLSQPADHPVNIYHPEGAYLKGLILAID